LNALAEQLAAAFLPVGHQFSIASLCFAFCVAVAFLALKQWRRRGRVHIAALARAIFSKRIILHPSTRADVCYFLLNTFVIGVLIGWTCISSGTMAKIVFAALRDGFGSRAPVEAPDIALRAGMTLLIFLAYELGYWIDHYLSHRIPFLWEFHKPHHSAQVLTPWTVWRVHPIDTIVFTNILALTIGPVTGLATYLLGRETAIYAIDGTNILLVAFVYSYVHLQHSQFWMPFTGGIGRVLMSPAHHQIHHSRDPAHFNCNFGSCLAVWDWLFGTLAMPTVQSPRLTYGVADLGTDAHSLRQLLVAPVRNAVASLGSQTAMEIADVQERRPAP
jgi:sterol desaturase/sphingolipid hydroxylase (fatty acid hydroxylase superfamily)